MADTEQIDIENAISVTLSEIFGSDLKIEVTETLRGSHRSKVMRCCLHSTSQNVPSTIIVKQVISPSGEIYDLTKPEGPAWRLFNEWAGLQFLKQCFGEQDLPVPHFIGGNREAGFILMEDLGSGKGLDHYLLATNAVAAQQHFINLFTVIGRIHAVTSGKQEEFDTIRSSLGPTSRKPLTEKIAWHRENQQKALSILDISPSPEYFGEFEECLRLLNQPGPFQVYCWIGRLEIGSPAILLKWGAKFLCYQNG